MKMKAYIHAQYDEYEKEHRFSVWSHDMSRGEMGYILIEEREIDFDAPPREVLVNGTVAEYRKMQQTLRTEAEEKCNRIQRSINDLLCIEYKPETAGGDS